MWLAGLEMLTTNPPLLRSLEDRLSPRILSLIINGKYSIKNPKSSLADYLTQHLEPIIITIYRFLSGLRVKSFN